MKWDTSYSGTCKYSADAAVLIASKGYHIPLTSSLLKLAWGLADSVDVEQFLSQLDGTPDASSMEMLSTHPFTNNRIRNLLRLVKRGDFRKQIGPIEDPRDTP